MSGLPSPEGVNEVRIILKEMRVHQKLIKHLSNEISVARIALEESKEKYANLTREFFKRLDEMDVARSGNAGWESRYGWFMMELIGQLEEEDK